MFSSSSGGGSSVKIRMSMDHYGRAGATVVTEYTWGDILISVMTDGTDGKNKRVSHYFKCPDPVLKAAEHWCQTAYAEMGLIEYLDKVFGDERPVL